MQFLKYLRIRVRTGKIACNWHGPQRNILRRTVRLVRMGSYAKMWTFYLYRGDGSVRLIEVAWPHWLGDWPKSAGNEPAGRS